MFDDSRLSTLMNGLQLYVQEFGQPESVHKLEGIIGSLMVIQQRIEPLFLTAKAAKAIAHQIAQAFADDGLRAGVDDLQATAQQPLIRAAHERWQTLEHQTRSVLSAYLQTTAFELSDAQGIPLESLRETVSTILPMVADGEINPAEAYGLLGHISQTFSLPEALAAAVHPPHVNLAQQLVVALHQRPLESAVRATLVAYREKYEPTLESFGVGLIEQAIQAATDGRLELDLDLDLDLAAKQVLIQQIAFKANILEASPPPSKTAGQIAEQINQEIQQFRAEQETALGTVDGTEGILSADGLTVSSPWKFTDADRANSSDPEIR